MCRTRPTRPGHRAPGRVPGCAVRPPAVVHRPAPTVGATWLLELCVRRAGPTTTCVTVVGEVDAWSARALVAVLDGLVVAPPPVIAVDLSGTTFLGCAGLTALADAAERARAHGSELLVTAANRHVRTVLSLGRLDRLVVVRRPPHGNPPPPERRGP